MSRLKAGLRWIGIGLLAAFSFLEAGAQAPLAALGASAPGVTQAMRDVKLSVTVAGRIESLQVSEGSRVREGQLLLHLDRTLEELEVQRRRLLLQDRARIEELRQKEKVLQQQVQSLLPLLVTGGVARKQFEDEEIALGSVVAERRALEASKEREQVELQLAQEAYERRHLRSPIAGVITKLAARQGESIGPSEPVITVVDTSRVRFIAAVPAAAGQRLRPGLNVRIDLGSELRLSPRQAQLVFVSPVTDPSSGLVEVIAEFDNLDGQVRPGITGRLLF
ncbi:MAG: efflux RND transporter periplasmic adaptor subunit [Betaproteobacteria bacterium]